MRRVLRAAMRERASRIIYKVAQACGINPQVLLVTLQKEQGLVTHMWPSDWRYTIAMGQGCPDTAACDTRYYGFFNQVYGAAWQFKRYANPPGTSQYFTWYAPGQDLERPLPPERRCGSSPVYIQNQATANLYYYTPYQPNAAALRAGYGEGDALLELRQPQLLQLLHRLVRQHDGGVGALVPQRRTRRCTLSRARSATAWQTSASTSSWRECSARRPSCRNRTSPLLTDAGPSSALLRDESTATLWLIQAGQRHKLLTLRLRPRSGAARAPHRPMCPRRC